MAKDPAFPFYAQDFLTGVMHMDFDLRGRYITLLAYQWNNNNKIPKKRLGFLIGFTWESMDEDLKEKFDDCGDYITNTRLLDERAKRDAFKKRQSQNGLKGGRPRKNSKPIKNPNETQKKPLENESEYEYEKEIEVKDEIIVKSKIDFDEIIKIYHAVCSGLPKIKKLTDARKTAIRSRIKEYNLETLGKVFQIVSITPFLNGENDRGWIADFDWILKPANFIKILENKYKTNGNRNTGQQKSDSTIKQQSGDAVDALFSEQQQL